MNETICILEYFSYIKWSGLGLVYGVLHHFQQYFSYTVAVSFNGGGIQSIRRKPPTCRKSLMWSDISEDKI
jgi:hypothetical protein